MALSIVRTQGPYTPTEVAIALLDAVENPVDIDPTRVIRVAHTLVDARGGAKLATQIITIAMRRRENSEATRLIRAVFRAVPAIAEALPRVSLASDDVLKMVVALLLHSDSDALKTLVVDSYIKNEYWCTLRRLDAYKIDLFFRLWFAGYTGEPGQMSRVIVATGAQHWYLRRGAVKNGVRCVKIWRRIANRLSMSMRDMHVHPTDPRFKMAWQAITEALDFCPLKTLPEPSDVFAENADQAAAYILLNPPGPEHVRTSMDCLRKLGHVGDLTNIIPTQWAKATWDLAQDIIPQSPGPCFRVMPTWDFSQADDCSDYFFALIRKDAKRGQLLAEPYDSATRSQDTLRRHSDAFEFMLHLMGKFPERFPEQLAYSKRNHILDTILCLATGIFKKEASMVDKIKMFLVAAKRFTRFYKYLKEVEVADAASFGAVLKRTASDKLVVYHVKSESRANRYNICPGDTIEMVRVYHNPNHIPEKEVFTNAKEMADALATNAKVDVTLCRQKHVSVFEELFNCDFEHWRSFGPYNRETELGSVYYRVWTTPMMQTLFQALRFVVLAFSQHPLAVVLNINVPDSRKQMIVDIHTSFPDIGNYGGFYSLSSGHLKKAYAAARNKKWVQSKYVSRFVNPTCRLFALKNHNDARARLRVRFERDGILAFLYACRLWKVPPELSHTILLFTI